MRRIRLLWIGCLAVALGVGSVMAQSETFELADLRGTWSGTWLPDPPLRDSVTIELRLDGEALVGEMLTPVRSDFTEVSFDSETSIIRAEAEDAEHSVRYAIEGRVEGTRISGTFSQNETSGEMNLVKWTFRP